MAGATLGTAIREVHRLFDEGTVAALTDGQLLDRFVERRDESAFEALVNRHGRMVLNTARAVLKDRHEAEDAFQSAFVALARRAATIRATEALGGWLHRVAYREAVRAHLDAGRRRTVAGPIEVAVAPADSELDDLRGIVHAELDRLPESFRLPVVLCDLEGLTKGQAAHSLGWTEAKVRGRLERARALLRSRLARHGLGTSAGVLVASIGRDAAAGLAGVQVAAAVRGAMAARVVGLGWIKVAVGIVLAVGGMAVAGSGRPDEPATMTPKVAAAPVVPEKKEDGEEVEVVGRVVDPSGKPVAGASVRLWMHPGDWHQGPDSAATTALDGRFSVRGPREAFRGRDESGPAVFARAAGFGPGRAVVGHLVEEPGEVTVELAVDDVPIEGRVVDLEGRPVSGATVKVAEVHASTLGDLSGWLDKIGRLGSTSPREWQGNRGLVSQADLPDATRTTDREGRFRLTGIGRERVATLVISGPSIATSRAFAVTRPGPAITKPVLDRRVETLTYHGARFDHVAPPTRPIEGAITDVDTGAPLAGIVIQGTVFDQNRLNPAPDVEATTDARGAYRLLGLGQADRYRLFLLPSPGQPYFQSSPVPPDSPVGPSAVRFDVGLKRGVIVRGRITDRDTGKPVFRANLETYAFADNPNVRDFPGFRDESPPRAYPDREGRFAIVALPGRGLLTANAYDARRLKASDVEQIEGFQPSKGGFETVPYDCPASSFHAIVAIDPPAGTESIERNLQVVSGLTLTGKVLDPEGRPIGGLMSGETGSGWLRLTPQKSPDFEVEGVDPAWPRRVYFFHEGRKLAGSVVLPPKEPGPITVKLQAWGSVTGRIVDDEGQPRPDYVLLVNMPHNPAWFDEARGFLPINEAIELGTDGRYRIDRLVPGLSYTAYSTKDNMAFGMAYKDVRVEAGEVKYVRDSMIVPSQN